MAREINKYTKDFAIVANPDRDAVTTGAEVRYTCLYQGGTGNLPKSWDRNGNVVDTHYFTWYKFADSAIVRGGESRFIERQFGGQHWDCKWTQKEGQYVIGCCITDRFSKARQWCFLGQPVVKVDSVLARLMGDARKHAAAHPDEAVRHMEEYLKTLRQAAEKFPPEDKQKSDEYFKKQEEYLTALKARLKPTDGKPFTRIPIYAVHWVSAEQIEFQLNVFIVKLRTEPERIEETGHDKGVLWKRIPKKEVWKLVDWTDPTRREMHHEFEAKDETDEAAIRRLIKSWDFEHNRYPPGKLSYYVAVGSIRIEGGFETNGRTAWDFVSGLLGWISVGAMVVAGIATLIAPVPGSRVVSFMIWTSILTSTASAGINIAQRLDQGYGTWKDNAIDGLTIVGNLLGGWGMATARVGQVAGSGAKWAKGATLKWNDPAGKAVKYRLIGQVGNDAVQGILVASKHAEDYEKIQNDKTLSPEKRTEKLLEWIRNVVKDGVLIFISMRSTKRDLAALDQPNKHLPNDPKKAAPAAKPGDEATWDDLMGRSDTLTPKKKLDMLGDPKQEIELQKAVPAEGHTNATGSKDKNRTEVHTSTGGTVKPRSEHASATKPTSFQDRFPSREDDFWTTRTLNPDEIVLRHNLVQIKTKGGNKEVVFHATCKEGVMKVESIRTYRVVDKNTGKLVMGHEAAEKALKDGTGQKVYSAYPEGGRALDAKELYEMMWNHFVGRGQEVHKIGAHFMFDNYSDFKGHLTAGKTPADALRATKTFQYWEKNARAHGYEVRIKEGSIREDVGNGVNWEADLVKSGG